MTDTGTWVRNRDVPGVSLYSTEGKIRYEVEVAEGGTIPVIAENIETVKRLLSAHGLTYVKATRTGQVLPLHRTHTQIDRDTAVALNTKENDMPRMNTTTDIDNLLNEAGKTESEKIAEKAIAKAPPATGTRKPADPKPASRKPAGKTSAQKAADRKAGTKAAQDRKLREQKAKAAAKPAPATPNPRSQKVAADAAKAVELYKDKTFSPETLKTPAARRKAIVAQLPQLRGRVRGILVAAGVPQPSGRG